MHREDGVDRNPGQGHHVEDAIGDGPQAGQALVAQEVDGHGDEPHHHRADEGVERHHRRQGQQGDHAGDQEQLGRGHVQPAEQVVDPGAQGRAWRNFLKRKPFIIRDSRMSLRAQRRSIFTRPLYFTGTLVKTMALLWKST